MLVILVEGLLHAGDRLVEVNGQPVFGLEPEQIIQILVSILSCTSVKYSFVHHDPPVVTGTPDTNTFSS